MTDPAQWVGLLMLAALTVLFVWDSSHRRRRIRWDRRHEHDRTVNALRKAQA